MVSRNSSTAPSAVRNLADRARAHGRGVSTNTAEAVLFQIGTVVAVALAVALVANFAVLSQ